MNSGVSLKRENVPSDKLDRIHGPSDAFYIPFTAGEVFILDIIGSDNGKAALWKKASGGINKKTWSAGTWERDNGQEATSFIETG